MYLICILRHKEFDIYIVYKYVLNMYSKAQGIWVGQYIYIGCNYVLRIYSKTQGI